MPPLTMEDLVAGYDNPDWCGVGYLGERRLALDDGESVPQPALVAEADALVLAVANDHGWTKEDLFAWLNSKPGRWYGVAWFGDDDQDRRTQSIHDNLTHLDLAEVRI